MIKSILSAISDRIDRRSRCNALGHDEKPEFIDPGEYLDSLPRAEFGQHQSDFAPDMLSPALAAVAGETPGEVSGFPLAPPSPGGSIADHVNSFKQSMAALSEIVGVPVDLTPVYRETANAMREFADLLDGTRPVREDDLAAHITQGLYERFPFCSYDQLADCAAEGLLASFRITYSPSK
ncbi:hypothetical protein A5721_30460 [Mycobacterium vulneris]|nr:hypothetical protein A5721_30460 [Mycolicibacterium vulneris]